MFNREVLLANEMDVIDLKWAWQRFRDRFLQDSQNILDWLIGIWRKTLPELKIPLGISVLLLLFGYLVGIYIANQFTLPPGVLSLDLVGEGVTEEFNRFGFFATQTIGWVLMNNLRVVALATILGAFTFGVLGQLSFMALWIIIGYVAGNLALAGESTLLFLGTTVLPHGVFEIPAALLAGAAILRLGLSAISLPQGTSLGEAYILALADWARVIIAMVVPLLILASVMEVFVTPMVVIQVLGG